jgi:23S rRNA (pseudouridine1915-N3)-methyltransferase
MKIKLLLIGKTTENYLLEAIGEYEQRIKRYITFEIKIIPELKNSKNFSVEQQKEREGALILNSVLSSDNVILLDDKGAQYTSTAFAGFLSQKMVASTRQLVFIVGGPYGFSPKVYLRADGQLSLSKMTFSHQMVRLLFVEQLYRAMTMLKGEPYHHE